MIRPYNEPGKPGDIYYRLDETEIFPYIMPDQELGMVKNEEGEDVVALRMVCETIPVTVLAIQWNTYFECRWALGHLYFDALLDEDQRFIPLHDEETARRLFPYVTGEFRNGNQD